EAQRARRSTRRPSAGRQSRWPAVAVAGREELTRCVGHRLREENVSTIADARWAARLGERPRLRRRCEPSGRRQLGRFAAIHRLGSYRQDAAKRWSNERRRGARRQPGWSGGGSRGPARRRGGDVVRREDRGEALARASAGGRLELDVERGQI